MVSAAEGAVPESLTCASAFGRVLGQFHDATDDFVAPTGSAWTRMHPSTLLGADPTWLERLYAHDVGQQELLVAWRAQAASVLETTGRELDLGMCHGEAYPSTCRIVAAGDGRLAIAELDWAGEGDRTYDLATFLWTLVLHTGGGAEELFSQFLDGYAGVRTVPDLSRLRPYVAARHLWSLRLAAGFADRGGLSRRAAFASTWSLTG